MKRVLITGGAGFIGSHLADALLADGYRVRVLDDLSPQVHGSEGRRPAYLADDVDLTIGDVRDSDATGRALEGVDLVFHFAAKVGVGQSMYQMAEYTSANCVGTAVLLEQIARAPVERLVVASSMSIYGEGTCRKADGTVVENVQRQHEQLRAGAWDPVDESGLPLEPLATPESKRPNPASVYALSKFDQERMSFIAGQAYGIPTIALRFSNVYGPRQALSNPYTGVLAIFAARLLNKRRPLVFEDGLQERDFVNVRDVVAACRQAMLAPKAPGRVFNIGSGEHYPIGELARRLAQALGRDFLPEITGKYRAGDIRHCFADIGLARHYLEYVPKVSLAEGLTELVAWLEGQPATDRVARARDELAARGLTL